MKKPLVIYREEKGVTVRHVIGECDISEDGTMVGKITNSADEHIFKAMMGGTGEFRAALGEDIGKFVVEQSDIDGMPK